MDFATPTACSHRKVRANSAKKAPQALNLQEKTHHQILTGGNASMMIAGCSITASLQYSASQPVTTVLRYCCCLKK